VEVIEHAFRGVREDSRVLRLLDRDFFGVISVEWM